MKRDRIKIMRIINGILLGIYLALLVWLLFFSERFGRVVDPAQPVRFNLIPTTEIRRFWTYRSTLGLRAMAVNLLGNILAFMPLGYLAPMTFPILRRASRIILVGFLLSLLAESIQLGTRVGSFDVDDVMLNTIGTWAGYLLFLLCSWIRRHYYGEKI